MAKTELSKRGKKAVKTELRADLDLFFEATKNIFHPVDNPKGTFPVNMAENNLSWDDLKLKIEQILKSEDIPKWVSNYTGMGGQDEYLQAVASFMTTHLTGCTIDSSTIQTSAGATAVLELASWVLCDSKDVVVIPAPSYPVYTQDFGNKSSLERYDLITHHDLKNFDGKSILKIKDLEKAKYRIEKAGKRFQLLIITTPDNPTGCIYTKKKLNKISDWCIKHSIHLLVNELYGLSIINTQNPLIKSDYSKHEPFYSFANVMKKKKSDFLHMSYGLSKDLGISGFRVGIIHSHNAKMLQAYANLNAPHLVSNLTQWALMHLLNDNEFMSDYILKNQIRLTANYALVIDYLKELDIPYAPARGSLFVWIDLSTYMKGKGQKSETKLWQNIYDNTGVLLTPGMGFGHSKRGQFRLVYSFLENRILKTGMKKLTKYLGKRK